MHRVIHDQYIDAGECVKTTSSNCSDITEWNNSLLFEYNVDECVENNSFLQIAPMLMNELKII